MPAVHDTPAQVAGITDRLAKSFAGLRAEHAGSVFVRADVADVDAADAAEVGTGPECQARLLPRAEIGVEQPVGRAILEDARGVSSAIAAEYDGNREPSAPVGRAALAVPSRPVTAGGSASSTRSRVTAAESIGASGHQAGAVTPLVLRRPTTLCGTCPLTSPSATPVRHHGGPAGNRSGGASTFYSH